MTFQNSIRNRWLRILLAMLVLTALSVAAGATRTAKGVVTDQNGKPIQGAIVQLENTRTLAIRSFITKKDGSYQFFQLDPNVDYRLSAAFRDASSGTKTLSTFDERSVAFIDLRIEVK
jgi:Carboxypeptidase regulatory-like domain